MRSWLFGKTLHTRSIAFVTSFLFVLSAALATCEPAISIHADKGAYRGKDSLRVGLSAVNPDEAIDADLYIGLLPATGPFYLCFQGIWNAGISPWKVHLPRMFHVEHLEICAMQLPSQMPPIEARGDYTLFAALTRPDSLEIQSVSTARFSYSATASEVFVDAELGNDAAAGTAIEPFRTISHAISSVEGTQSEPYAINVGAGTYSPSTNGETFPLHMKSWGSLIGAGPDLTILDAEGTANVIVMSGIENASLIGFRITGGNAADGGAMSCVNSSAVISDNAITGNTGDRGGAAYCMGGDLVFERNEISGNRATGQYGFGGAMFLVMSDPTFSDNTIVENTGDSVGAFYMYDSSATFQNNTIGWNTATDQEGLAGGLYIQWGTPRLLQNDIVHNAATGEAGYVGGVYIFNSAAEITGNNITNNEATGDYGLAGGLFCTQASPTISGNTFTENFATGVGALYCQQSSPDISSNLFERNAGLAGAVCCALTSEPRIFGNHVSSNDGFGIACFPGCSPIILNNLIVGNRPSSFGASGIWCWDSSAEISNNTVADNAGVGITSYRSSPSIENCIIWGNGDDLWNCRAAYCCIQDEDIGLGNFHQDPLFVDGPLGGYYLRPESHCIDAGSVTSASAGLDTHTTQADGTLDTGLVDLGYHYPIQ